MKRAQTLPNLLDPGPDSSLCGSNKRKNPNAVTKANYGVLRSRLVSLTPESLQCRMYCGGPEKCKYCSLSFSWPKASTAIPGIFSHWVSPRIVAMARPTHMAIKAKNLVQVMKENGIRSIVNLQKAGEHAECSPNEMPTGFSYDSKEFMDAGIAHYNFGWPDFGVGPVGVLLDMVKVLDFACSEGAVAVHCHAGLGRTGVLIAAFLVWQKSIPPDEAISLLRYKRPRSVQTRGQVATVFAFAEELSRLRRVFPERPIPFEEALRRQSAVLHGLQARLLHHLPKVVLVICERLMELGGVAEEGRLRRRLRDLQSPDDGLYDHILRHSTAVDASDAHAPKPPPMRKTSLMVSMLTADQGQGTHRSRLPPITTTPSKKTVTFVFDQLLQGMAASIRKDFKWEVIVKSCLADLKVPESGDSVYGAVGYYQKCLRFDDDEWESLSKESDEETLMLLLQSWFSSLSGPVIREATALPQIISADSMTTSLELSTGEKWTYTYICRVFALFCGQNASNLTLTAKLVSLWICRTSNDEIVNYVLACLNKFVPNKD